jgi:hypothetical protein
MFGQRTSRICVAALFAFALTAAGAAAHSETRTLEDEHLIGAAGGTVVTFDCNPAGISTVRWTAAGPATGPFPGTYAASGVLTIGPQETPVGPPAPDRDTLFEGPILSFRERFAIDSALGTVTGRKMVRPAEAAQSGTTGTCQQVSQFPVLDLLDGSGTIVIAHAQAHYKARINDSGETFRDSGLAFFALSEFDITGNCPAGPSCHVDLATFDQLFALSDQSLPPVCEEEDDDEECDDEG